MTKIKRFFHGLFSMRTAIITLLILIVACIVGSIIPQGQAEAYYAEAYSGSLQHLILLTGANDVFHQWWFFALSAFLCLNLLGCNLIRFPSIRKRQKSEFTLEERLKNFNTESGWKTKDPSALFASLGFHQVQSKEFEGKEARYAVRHSIGLWGAWLTHFGLLIIIIGFTLGQTLKQEYTVYGVPGETRRVGDTSYALTIEDFWIDTREDDSIEQFTARVKMTDMETGKAASGETSVNHPCKLFGMKLFQNSYGWAANVVIQKNEQPLQTVVLCTGEYIEVADKPGLIILLNNVYPDLAYNQNGMPVTASDQIGHPGYLYTVYYNGSIIGMNVLEEGDDIHIDEYTVSILNPQHYTLIQIKSDPFTWIVLIGGLILLTALFISFYLRTEEVFAIKDEENDTFIVGCRSIKGQDLFEEKLQEALKEGGN